MLKDKDLVAIQEVRSKVEQAWEAFQKYRSFSQQQVDSIVEAIGEAARKDSVRLAEMAVDETGYGNARDKLAKNLLAAEVLPRHIRGMKTIGVIRERAEDRVTEIAVPVGVVAAVLPTTNPTSTAIYKSIISLKAGNAVVLSPHPHAKASTCATASVITAAAAAAGAPAGLVQCIENPTIEATEALMRHPRTGIILSTGGHGIVRAAYSSGKPAFGVGPGNVPALIDASANVAEAVGRVLDGKSFDFGTVCSSEQTIVAEKSLKEPILAALEAGHAYRVNTAQAEALAKLLITPNWTVNPRCVGQPAAKLAKMAGFEVPAGTRVLVTEINGVGKDHPLSAEKLSPVLSVYFVESFPAALDACEALLRFGGLGHTCVIHANDEKRVLEFGLRMPAFRILVNTSSPHGSVGITTNVSPAMTLGCGAMGGNATGDNIGPEHLFHVKRIAWAVRRVEDALTLPDAPQTATERPAVEGLPSTTRIHAAVDRYFARAGVPAPGAAKTSIAEQVVDRFLAARRGAPIQPAAPAPPAASAPTLPIVPFVCEADVRAAIAESRKIRIGRKTIVTPSARDLAAGRDILVVAE